jgi:hypothetical protein
MWGSCELRGEGGAPAPGVDAGGEGREVSVLTDDEGVGSGWVSHCCVTEVLTRLDIGGAHSMGAPITVRER